MADAVPEDLQVLLLAWNRAKARYANLVRESPACRVLPMGERVVHPRRADAIEDARQEVLRLAAEIEAHPASVAASARMRTVRL